MPMPYYELSNRLARKLTPSVIVLVADFRLAREGRDLPTHGPVSPEGAELIAFPTMKMDLEEMLENLNFYQSLSDQSFLHPFNRTIPVPWAMVEDDDPRMAEIL